MTNLKAILVSTLNDAIVKSRDGEFELRFVSTKKVHEALDDAGRGRLIGGPVGMEGMVIRGGEEAGVGRRIWATELQPHFMMVEAAPYEVKEGNKIFNLNKIKRRLG